MQLRRELSDERDRLLVTLKGGRDNLSQTLGAAADRKVDQLTLAFEIIIAIVERESFIDMAAERLPVVLRQIESRLWRLGDLIQVVRRRAACSDAEVYDPEKQQL
jgi:hypothetical protein